MAARAAFTLVELLTVVVIISILLVLIIPAVASFKSSGDFSRGIYEISGALESARSYAMASDTFTWVGFYEEDSSAATPSANKPPYPGKGRILLAVVASKDGTSIEPDANTATVFLDPARLTQISKLIRIEGIHLADIGAPPTSPSSAALPDSLETRSGLPYDATLQGPETAKNRISSDSAEVTLRPFVAQGYTFYKTVRFSPRGEANLNSTYTFRRVAEIGLRPAHGSVVDNVTLNVAAIQFTGISGSLKMYR